VNVAFAPLVRCCQAEHTSRTAKEGFLRAREDGPARRPHCPPAEAVQQRRAMIPPDQRHIIAVNVHEPILVYLR